MGEQETFRPRSSTWLFATALVVAVLLAVGVLSELSVSALPRLAWPLLVALAGYLFFRAPHLRVDDSGVFVRNVLRTVHLPWPTIVLVDTKYTLTLHTADASCQVWAAPVAGRHSTTRITRDDLRGLPESTYGGGGVRPGDAMTSPSGQAAYLVRRRWDALRDAGHLDAPEPGRKGPEVHWNHLELAALAVLVVLAVGTLV